MRRYETQNTLLICKEPIAKAFYTNSGQKAFVYIGSPGGRSNGRLRIFPAVSCRVRYTSCRNILAYDSSSLFVR